MKSVSKKSELSLAKNCIWSGTIRFFSSRLFKIIISAGLLFYIFYAFEPGAIVSSMISANPWYVAGAIFIFIGSGVLGAFQWGIILRFHGIQPGFYATVSRYFMGLFFNFILPGFVGGDVVRVYKTSVSSGLASQAFSSTLADRVIGLLVLVLFSFGGFIFMPDGMVFNALPVAITLFFILAGFISLFVFKPAGRLFNRVFGSILPIRILAKLRAVYLEMHELTRSPRILITLLVLSLFIQFTRIAVHYTCGIAVGIDIGFSFYALFVPLMAVMASLPVSIGGFGVRETFAVVLFSSVGLEEEIVLSYIFLTTISSFIGALPGGVAFALSINSSEN